MSFSKAPTSLSDPFTHKLSSPKMKWGLWERASESPLYLGKVVKKVLSPRQPQASQGGSGGTQRCACTHASRPLAFSPSGC